MDGRRLVGSTRDRHGIILIWFPSSYHTFTDPRSSAISPSPSKWFLTFFLAILERNLKVLAVLFLYTSRSCHPVLNIPVAKINTDTHTHTHRREALIKNCTTRTNRRSPPVTWVESHGRGSLSSLLIEKYVSISVSGYFLYCLSLRDQLPPFHHLLLISCRNIGALSFRSTNVVFKKTSNLFSSYFYFIFLLNFPRFFRFHGSCNSVRLRTDYSLVSGKCLNRQVYSVGTLHLLSTPSIRFPFGQRFETRNRFFLFF